MSNLLRQPTLEPITHRLGSNTPEYIDPETKARLDQATEDGYRRGLIDGDTNARAALLNERRNALAAVNQATSRALEDIEASLTAATRQMLTLAFDLAEVIAGHTIGDGSVIAERIEAALDEIDDDEITLAVSQHEKTMFEDAHQTRLGLTVVADATLQPGEATIRGRWSNADLTRKGIREALEQSLDA